MGSEAVNRLLIHLSNIPGPERLAEDAVMDADGYCMIDCVGAWECMLTKFAMLSEVPT